MERRRSKLPDTIDSLVGLKSDLTQSWVKSVCNIAKNIPSSEIPLKKQEEEDESVLDQVQSIKDQLSSLTIQVNDQNKRRREILNEFLDLKGNIRVFCRVRPLDSKKLKPPVTSDTRNVFLKLTETKKKTYDFDRVFEPDSSQDDVFLEIEPVIKSVIDGYNACIFAYGQTGTGKTFTMEGSPESPGIVPRAIKGLFKQVDESNHLFVVKFSMLEIYMGNLRDLLVSQGTKPVSPIPPSLSIHADAKGEVDIENLVTLRVKNFEQVHKLYKLGCKNRATAFTNSNSASSRSHCMIRVTVTCLGATERRRETNKIWLVDLGGSERVLKTGATGRRFDEGKAINLSLSALGDVINSLQHKSSHIPYRNSKLTQVLKDSLGLDSKTLMLVHVSPKEEDLCETICSLNFATRAKNIHLGQEESTEEQLKKEAMMINLQKMMEKIEQDREMVLREMRNLNGTLEKLTGKPHVVEVEEEDVITEAVQVTPKIRRNNSRRASDVFPSFMKPTASSRRMSTDFGTLSNTPSFKSRRHSMASVRAESVSLPIKKKGSESICDSSDRSISKSTIRQNVADDSATVYSQDISECEIKVVVSEQKRKIPVSPTKPRYNVEKNLKQEAGNTKLSRINSWVRKQSEIRSYVLQKKQPPVTPLPEKLQRLDQNISLDMSSTTSDKISSEMFEKLEDIEEIKPNMMLNDLFELQCLCSPETEDKILSRYRNPYYDFDDNESLDPPSLEYIDDVWFGADHSADWEKDTPASIALVERKPEIKQLFPETDLDQSVKPKSQRGLEFTETVAPPFRRLQGTLVQRGKVCSFVQKVQALCYRVLLGLGFIGVGYGNDFFNVFTK